MTDDVMELVEALLWYEEQAANCRKFGPDGVVSRDNLDRDGGQRAKAALEALSRDRAGEQTVVAVKPLEWEETWSGGDDDIPCWRGRNPLHLHVGFSFAGRLFDGRQIERHNEAPVADVEAAKAAAQADYEKRILSALATSPATPDPKEPQ